jgi:hypothetical protein
MNYARAVTFIDNIVEHKCLSFTVHREHFHTKRTVRDKKAYTESHEDKSSKAKFLNFLCFCAINTNVW